MTGSSVSAVQSQCSDRVVAAGGLAQGTTGGGRRLCPGIGLTGSARHRFTGSGAVQAQACRINALLRLQHGSMMRVEAPHPCVIDSCVAKFQQPRLSSPGALVLVHLEPLMDARVHASCDDGLDLQSFVRQEMFTVSNAIDGEGRSCVAS